MILVSIWNYSKFTVKYKYNLNNICINELIIWNIEIGRLETSLKNILLTSICYAKVSRTNTQCSDTI